MAAAAQPRHPFAADRQHLPRLGAGSQLDLDRTLETGHLERPAESRERSRHVEGGDQVVALADEAIVGPDTDQHVQVAGGGAASPA